MDSSYASRLARGNGERPFGGVRLTDFSGGGSAPLILGSRLTYVQAGR